MTPITKDQFILKRLKEPPPVCDWCGKDMTPYLGEDWRRFGKEVLYYACVPCRKGRVEELGMQ